MITNDQYKEFRARVDAGVDLTRDEVSAILTTLDEATEAMDVANRRISVAAALIEVLNRDRQLLMNVLEAIRIGAKPRTSEWRFRHMAESAIEAVARPPITRIEPPVVSNPDASGIHDSGSSADSTPSEAQARG